MNGSLFFTAGLFWRNITLIELILICKAIGRYSDYSISNEWIQKNLQVNCAWKLWMCWSLGHLWGCILSSLLGFTPLVQQPQQEQPSVTIHPTLLRYQTRQLTHQSDRLRQPFNSRSQAQPGSICCKQPRQWHQTWTASFYRLPSLSCSWPLSLNWPRPAHRQVKTTVQDKLPMLNSLLQGKWCHFHIYFLFTEDLSGQRSANSCMLHLHKNKNLCSY